MYYILYVYCVYIIYCTGMLYCKVTALEEGPFIQIVCKWILNGPFDHLIIYSTWYRTGIVVL